jgi:hypothetical protein
MEMQLVVSNYRQLSCGSGEAAAMNPVCKRARKRNNSNTGLVRIPFLRLDNGDCESSCMASASIWSSVNVHSYYPIRHVVGCSHSNYFRQSLDHILRIGCSDGPGRQLGDQLLLQAHHIGCLSGYREVHAAAAADDLGTLHTLPAKTVEEGARIAQERYS